MSRVYWGYLNLFCSDSHSPVFIGNVNKPINYGEND